MEAQRETLLKALDSWQAAFCTARVFHSHCPFKLPPKQKSPGFLVTAHACRHVGVMRQACVCTSHSARTHTVSYVSGQSAVSDICLFVCLLYLALRFMTLHYAKRKTTPAPGMRLFLACSAGSISSVSQDFNTFLPGAAAQQCAAFSHNNKPTRVLPAETHRILQCTRNFDLFFIVFCKLHTRVGSYSLWWLPPEGDNKNPKEAKAAWEKQPNVAESIVTHVSWIHVWRFSHFMTVTFRHESVVIKVLGGKLREAEQVRLWSS